MKDVGIGLIGTGFMGKCHAMAFGAVKAESSNVPRLRLEFLCDSVEEVARPAASMSADRGNSRNSISAVFWLLQT